jgi:hypothetical protein
VLFSNNSGGKAGLKVNEISSRHLVHLSSVTPACTAEREGALRYEPSLKRVQVCASGSWQTMTVVRWCLPPWRYAPAHDTHDVVMHMREDDAARMPQGSPCLKSQIDPSRRKRDADIDHRPNRKRRRCINNYNCQDYREFEQ